MQTISMSLEEKVRAIIMQDDNGDGPTGTVANQPDWHRYFEVSDFEADMRAWGCVYGIAFGLARSEEPCEPIESVSRRAYEAAWPAYVAYAGGFEPRKRDGERS